jgi:pyridoxine 5-phosphate synthase
MPHLCVNIDHVATVRQARYRAASGKGKPAPRGLEENYGEPDVTRAAHEAELGGADGITVHLREDRRHITDRDVALLRDLVRVKFNLEMAATVEMIAIARNVKPHTAMLVPEGRMEVTTEGGLNVKSNLKRLTEVVKRLQGAGCIVSAFIDADPAQVEASHKAGFDVCEIHTGPYAEAFRRAGGDMLDSALQTELGAVAIAGGEVLAHGMRFNAGHALNYSNVRLIATIPGLSELHIGHAIVSRAVFTGLREAVREMKVLVACGE